MATYLPVLLVSVTSNPSVDDSSLETLPRGQVDYLSHDWTEEDVWRSWRNMTRQKNEIANGMRLENASWRTWWKQRNKLKTVTPETLNWLKDSDVTWLYGPLHTAVDWTPPPKPKPDPTSVDKDISALDRLDLSTSAAARRASAAHEPKQKSILKYRSISELLTSDLPASIMGASPRFGMSPQGSDGEVDPDDAQAQSPKRPPLSHTKSDTHVATLGSSGKQALAAMGLRKDSPPRVGPAGHVQLLTSPPIAANSSGDSSDLAHESSPSGSVSPDSRVNLAPHDITSGTHGRHKKKQKHIAFNTFVEQCIAIEKPKKSHLDRPKPSKKPKRPRPGLGYETSGNWNGKTQGMRWDGVEEDEDEDEERVASDVDFDDSSESDDGAAMDHQSYAYYPSSWYSNECAIDSSEESDAVDDEGVFEDDCVQDVLCDNDNDDDGAIETRISRQTSQKSPNRSQSRVSESSNSSTSTSTSALSTTSTDETSPSPARESDPKPLRRRRRSRKSVPEHSLHHRLSTSSQSSNATIIARRKSFSHPSNGTRLVRKDSSSTNNHITIAPIAPTILKTTGVGNGWDGFGSGYGRQYRPLHAGGWMDGFGDDSYSDDGGAMRWYPGKWASGDDNPSSDIETPVELVYVPPGGRYTGDGHDGESLEREYHHQEAYFSMDDASQPRRYTASVQPVPYVVRTPVPGAQAEDDTSDYFTGPDFGEDFMQRPRRMSGSRSASRSEDSREEDTQHPSRSRSRTPSPTTNETGAMIVPDRTSSLSPTLLSPPPRGRASFQQQQQEEHISRGRSSKRTSPSSLSDRERSAQTSPFGSLSPDGPAIGLGAYGVYANGRIDRERERERERERGQARKGKERGRERTERRLDHSHSSSSPGGSDVTDRTVSSPSLSISPPAATSVSSQRPREALMDVSHTTANSPANVPTTSAARESPRRQPSPSSPTYPTSPLAPSTSVTSTPAMPRLVGRGPSTPMHTSKATKEADGTFVGKAIGMVSSTGAYFGLWPTDGRA